MVWIMRFGVALVGAFTLVMGFMAVTDPHKLAGILGGSISSPLSENSVRADLGAFFLFSAVTIGAALWMRQARLLWAPALIFSLAAMGRVYGILVSGPPEGVAVPLMTEIVIAGILSVGAVYLSQYESGQD